MLDRIQKAAHRKIVHLIALACSLAGLASVTIASRAPVQDADVWWHMRVGEWIFANHGFPQVGIFSRTAATTPWMAYSWGYEVLLARAYAWFGLPGLAWYGVLLVVAAAAAYFWMLQRISGTFWLSIFVCLLGGVSFLFNILPRPAFFSMAFFPVVLTLLVEANRIGRIRTLYWLPPLFLVWANCHIQFVYGLLVVWLFTVAYLLRPIFRKLGWVSAETHRPELESGKLAAMAALCTLATCIGPYTYRVYQVVLGYSQVKYPYLVLQDLQSPDFKHPSDFALALLAIWAAAAVYRHRDELTPFRILLLLVASVLGYRAVRDAWLLAATAGAFVAESQWRQSEEKRLVTGRDALLVAVLLMPLLFGVGRATGFDGLGLDRTVSAQFPVDAANFLRRHPVPGPLYNEFGWGGFLIWYLPQYPVAIDPRTDLYGDEIDFMTYKAALGDYAGDRFLEESHVVLLPREVPLASLLGSDPKFRVVYEDRIAVVLVRN